MKICKHCRDFFKVWPGVDDRLALSTRDTTINPNWLLGGARRGPNKKPNALLLKKMPVEMNTEIPAPPGNVDEDFVGDNAMAGDGSEADDTGGNGAGGLDAVVHDAGGLDAGGLDAGGLDAGGIDDGGIDAGGVVDDDNEAGGNETGGDHDDDADGNDSYEIASDLEFEIGPEDRVNGLEDMLDNNSDDEADGNEDTDDEGDNGATTIESIAEPFLIDSNFLRGRILMLPVSDGSIENPCCAICNQLADEHAEPITVLLENRLRLNPIFSNDSESFGIAFKYYEYSAEFQVVCTDCLATSQNSPEGQTCYPKVFRIEFHKKCGNLSVDHPNNVEDLFNAASSISSTCIKELRDRIAELEKELR